MWSLLDHPNPHGPNFYRSRLQPIRLVVVHTAESLPDFEGPDHGAESVAGYGSSTDRDVSWHQTVDSDSTVPMLPDSYTAWHVADYNSCSLGVEIATQAASWPTSPDEWDLATLARLAAVVSTWCDTYGIPKRRITKAQADAGERGICAHADLDPTRRTDPGPAFPWDLFLDLLNGELDMDAVQRILNRLDEIDADLPEKAAMQRTVTRVRHLSKAFAALARGQHPDEETITALEADEPEEETPR